jgi:hypothetical protein
MGTEIRPTSFRLNDSRLGKIDSLVEKFAPFTSKRSHVLNLAVDVLYVIVFTQGTVQVVVDWLQCLLRTTSYAQRGGFPGEQSPTTGGAGSDVGLGRPRSVSLLSRRSGLSRASADVEMVAWSPSFLRLISHSARSLAS